MGNGSAMRVAPVGAWFADDLNQVVKEAEASAVVTHQHPEGIAGAIATAIAAAMAWQLKSGNSSEAPSELLNTVLQHTPAGRTQSGIAQACKLLNEDSPERIAQFTGCPHFPARNGVHLSRAGLGDRQLRATGGYSCATRDHLTAFMN